MIVETEILDRECPKEFRFNERTFKLLEVDKGIAIFQEMTNIYQYYEVHRLRWAKPKERIIGGRLVNYKGGIYLGRSEEFGTIAWGYTSLPFAQRKALELRTGTKESHRSKTVISKGVEA